MAGRKCENGEPRQVLIKKWRRLVRVVEGVPTMVGRKCEYGELRQVLIKNRGDLSGWLKESRQWSGESGIRGTASSTDNKIEETCPGG